MRIVCFPQNNYRQPFAKTVQDHERDMTDEEQDERAKSQEMQAPCTLPSVKDFDVPREAAGDGGGHCYPCRHAERCEQEYDCRVTQLLQRIVCSRCLNDVKGQVAEHRASGIR